MEFHPDVIVGDGAAVKLALEFVLRVETGGDWAALLSPGAVEEELPNRFVPHGATRDVAAMQGAMARGKTLFKEQSYFVRQVVGSDSVAALDVQWRGVLSVAVGNLAAGATMRAAVAYFFETDETQIVRIRHFDCVEPLG